MRLTDPAARSTSGVPVSAPTPGRVRAMLVLAVGVALLLVAGVGALITRPDPGIPLNALTADSLRVSPFEGRVSGYSPPGIHRIAGLVSVYPTAPITLLDVRAYRTTPGVSLLTRAAFSGGFGDVSPSGHLKTGGGIAGICHLGSWPPVGFGQSYPTAGLALVPGDALQLLFFVRGPEQVGDYAVIGYRITYRTASGKIHTIKGDAGRLEMYIREPADLVNQEGQCRPFKEQPWANPAAGFPN